MDTVDWAQTRFDEITKKLGSFLKQAGFRPSDISYIPCSGLSGENLTTKSTEPKLEWYKGSTIIDQIGMNSLLSVADTSDRNSVDKGEKNVFPRHGPHQPQSPHEKFDCPFQYLH